VNWGGRRGGDVAGGRFRLATPAIVLFPLAILLFPDGTLPSPRWRWVLGAYLVIGACWPVSIYTVAVATITGHHIQVTAGGDLTVIDQPSGSAAWPGG
jgi:hypothetical protein